MAGGRGPEDIFQRSTSAQEAAFNTARPYLDLPIELGSDATTVPRILRGLRAHLPAAPNVELLLHVQAVIVANLDAPWIGRLYAAVPPGVRPMKWPHVQRYIIEGVGSEPQLVREGLQSQTVVLTDAHETARSLDLSVSIQGAQVPVATMLLMRKWSGVPGADLDMQHQKIRGWLLRDVLDRSGAGTLNSLVREAMSRDLDGLTASRRGGPDFAKSVIEELERNWMGRSAGSANSLARPLPWRRATWTLTLGAIPPNN